MIVYQINANKTDSHYWSSSSFSLSKTIKSDTDSIFFSQIQSFDTIDIIEQLPSNEIRIGHFNKKFDRRSGSDIKYSLVRSSHGVYISNYFKTELAIKGVEMDIKFEKCDSVILSVYNCLNGYPKNVIVQRTFSKKEFKPPFVSLISDSISIDTNGVFISISPSKTDQQKGNQLKIYNENASNIHSTYIKTDEGWVLVETWLSALDPNRTLYNSKIGIILSPKLKY